jgi:hypothetical protein
MLKEDKKVEFCFHLSSNSLKITEKSAKKVAVGLNGIRKQK